MTGSWESATFEGAQDVQARALAATTPDERFRWLMDALDLAAASGALARARADKQAWCESVWHSGDAGPMP